MAPLSDFVACNCIGARCIFYIKSTSAARASDENSAEQSRSIGRRALRFGATAKLAFSVRKNLKKEGNYNLRRKKQGERE